MDWTYILGSATNRALSASCAQHPKAPLRPLATMSQCGTRQLLGTVGGALVARAP